MVNGDPLPSNRTGTDIVVDRILDAQRTPGLQEQDGHCGELLGDRGKAVFRLRCAGQIFLEIRLAVPFAEIHHSILGDEHGAGEHPHFRRVCEHLVHIRHRALD
jgi:hypothetical protein